MIRCNRIFVVSVLFGACLAMIDQAVAQAVRADQSGVATVAEDKPAPEAGARKEPLIIRGDDQVIAPAKERPEAKPGEPVALRFEQAPVTDVVNTVMGEILKANYVIHQPVSGSITLSANTPVPIDQVVVVLESALLANGVLMVQDARGTYHIGRPEALKGVVAVPKRVGKGPLPPGYGTVIIPLRYIGAAEMAEILKPLATPESFVRVDPLRNLLVMAGTRNQIEGWQEMIATFDVNMLKGMSVGLFPLQHITSSDVEAAMRLMTTSLGGKADASGILPSMGALRILPIAKINSVLVVSPRAALIDQAKIWIEKIDRPMVTENETQLFVYHVQNGSATQLAAVLAGVFGGTTTTTASKSGSGVAPGLNSTSGTTGTSSGVTGTGGITSSTGNSSLSASSLTSGNQSANKSGASVTAASLGDTVKVVADERNNSLVFYCTAAEYKKIESSLKRLDITQAQVLIEATIIEVTLKGNLQFGIGWNFDGGAAYKGWNGNGSLGVSASDSTNTISSGFTYALTNPMGVVKAKLQALASDSLVKVISNPTVMVLDNQTASIVVGEQIPAQTGSSVTNGVTTYSTSYLSAGVNMKVTPSVNAGDVVSLLVDQAVVDVGAKDSTTGQYQFYQRQIGTRVAVKSGETVVMGGLIKGNSSTSTTGIPFLKDIPLIGRLFQNSADSKDRTEMLLLITPRVLRSETDASDVSTELRERIKGLKGLEKELGVSLPSNSAVDIKALPSLDVGSEPRSGRAEAATRAP